MITGDGGPSPFLKNRHASCLEATVPRITNPTIGKGGRYNEFQDARRAIAAEYLPDSVEETRDPFRMYIREISRHSILSKEEELEVAERIRLHKDKEAEQRLVTGNLRLVVKIALQYSNFEPNLLDLVQEGNVGLLRAVGKYDSLRGTRFSTYASFWIRAYILKYIMDSRSLVKIGTKDTQRKLFFSLNKEREKLEKVGIVPSAQILAENLDVTTSDVEDMEMRLRNADVSLGRAPVRRRGPPHGYDKQR